jgi:hypothetical protein
MTSVSYQCRFSAAPGWGHRAWVFLSNHLDPATPRLLSTPSVKVPVTGPPL